MLDTITKDTLKEIIPRSKSYRAAALELQRVTGVRMTRRNIQWHAERMHVRPNEPQFSAAQKLREKLDRPPAVEHSETPCDLCGEVEPGPRWRGNHFGLEGLLCKDCRQELIIESWKRNNRDRWHKEHAETVARRNAPDLPVVLTAFWGNCQQHWEHEAAMARAAPVRIEAGWRPTLPRVLDPWFSVSQLRGRAFSYWLLRAHESPHRTRILLPYLYGLD